MFDDEVPPLDQLEADDLDLGRVATMVASAMAVQPGDLFDRFVRGDFAGSTAMTPFDDEGMATVSIAGLPIVRLHYSRLVRWIPLDLVDRPPVALPPETVRVDDPRWWR